MSVGQSQLVLKMRPDFLRDHAIAGFNFVRHELRLHQALQKTKYQSVWISVKAFIRPNFLGLTVPVNGSVYLFSIIGQPKSSFRAILV